VGKYYWYKFTWLGKLVRESTKQGNDKLARNIESAHRTSLRIVVHSEVILRPDLPSGRVDMWLIYQIYRKLSPANRLP
jgi:hypothetical protein